MKTPCLTSLSIHRERAISFQLVLTVRSVSGSELELNLNNIEYCLQLQIVTVPLILSIIALNY